MLFKYKKIFLFFRLYFTLSKIFYCDVLKYLKIDIRVIESKLGYVIKTRHELKFGDCFTLGICSKIKQKSSKTSFHFLLLVQSYHFLFYLIVLAISYKCMV